MGAFLILGGKLKIFGMLVIFDGQRFKIYG
jgi:hypothetical protein